MRTRRIAPLLALLCFVVLAAHVATAEADHKRVFMAPDDHTDYFWSATDVEYRQLFQTMLDYYLDQVQATAGERPELQSRFSTDGSLWLWEYEKNKTPAEFQRLVNAIKSGHISAPKNPLVITYGGVPAEAVIRSMYYSGQLERRYGLDFPLAIAMENAGMAYGLGAVWAGSGVRYSWKGVCNCPSLIPDLDDRQHEIYSWLGPDGSRILMKWNSLHDARNNESIGGYAEARYPGTVLDLVTRDAAFAARYPYSTIGVFGQGWDDLSTTNLKVQQTCKSDSDPNRTCIVSNSVDFFQEFDPLFSASLPTVSASFGNEWDLAPASLAEVSARIKRSLERLRSAEGLATLVSLKNPSFMNGREAARDRAFLDMGLYFEHDFENGGPRVSGAQRIAWQRQVAGQIEQYVDPLLADATTALGTMIGRTGSAARFFAFNPLSWARTDVADLPYGGALPAYVVDLATGTEVPSQVVTVGGTRYVRVVAPNVPSVGYKVFEVRPGTGQTFANGPMANASTGVMENEFYRITVSPRGAITSFVDKRQGNREFAGSTGGFALNDLGPGSGSRQIENAGPVSVTLVATGTAPLAHVTRVTLTRGSDRVDIRNEVTQNFGGTQLWRFSLNLTSPDVRHEEVGAIMRARLTSDGGHYSPRNARYDFLTLNHFADMSGAGSVGMTLSNMDAYFMQVGASGVTNLDTTTPQLSVVLGSSARPANPILNQAGDSYFLQRFALASHGAYDQPAAMRFALAHQNPLTVGAVSGGSGYPEASYSLLSISDPGVLLWALKPAEEGIGQGLVARVWNMTGSPSSFTLALDQSIASARRVWHTETDRDTATLSSGVLTSSIAQNQLLSFRLFPGTSPTPPPPPPPPSSGDALFGFAEGSGGTATDVSGTQTATLQNGTLWTSGRYGSGLGFDGVDDHVTVPDSPRLDLGGTGTVEAWIRLSSLGRWHGVVSKGAPNSDPQHNYALEVDNANRFLCIIGNGSVSMTARSTATASAGQFYHLACTWDGAALSLYVNGALTASVAQVITPAANTQPMYIGQFGAGFDRLHGTVDEVRIYSRARTQAEIQADMDTPIGAPPPPRSFTLTVTRSGTGTGTVTGTTAAGTVVTCGSDCGETAPEGTQITLTAAADSGSSFTGWSGGGCSGTAACTLALAADTVVAAAFARNPEPPPPPPPPGGLVAAYAFDEANGATAADSSGRGNTGLVAGATWTSQGRFGAALVFDGGNDWVAISDAASLDLTSGLTLEAWVFPTVSTGWRTVILKEQPGQQVYALYSSSGNNTPAGQVYVSTAGQRVHGPSALPINTWTHLATTYDGVVQRLYVNGVEVATRAQTGPVRTSDSPLRIGGNSVWGEFFQGRIDEARIYSRALAADEIRADMNTPIGAAGAAMAAAAGGGMAAAGSGSTAQASASTLASPAKSSSAESQTDAAAATADSAISGAQAAMVEGTVFAADGATPVPESLVELLAPGTGSRLAATVTGASGAYRFAGVADGVAGATIRAHAPAPAALAVEQPASSRTVDLTLPLSVVRGTASFSSGVPVRFPAAFLQTPDGLFSAFAAVSDELGRFVIFGAPAGAFRLSVQDADSALLTTIAGELIRLDVPATVEVQLPRAGRVTGRVVGRDGKGMAFARVALESTGFVRFASADAEGVYEFRKVGAGPVSVYATSFVDGAQLNGGAAGHLAPSDELARLDVVLTEEVERR
jgi:alpha-mannosidase